MPIVLQAPATHLYPGLEGAVVPDGQAAPDGLDAAPADCVVEFSDGSIAHGRLAPEAPGRHRLDVEGYTTARGTEIPAKVWPLAITADGERRFRFRITGRGAQNF
jgi:hypothetical protein